MNKLSAIFDALHSKKVFVIGDIMIDSYMWGRTDRISPEAPVPVVSITEKENRMGGAANVGLNIKAMGAEAVLCSVLGNDNYGSIFRKLLAKRNMSDRGLVEASNRPTTVKTRVIASSQHLLRVDEEITTPIDFKLEKKFISHVCNLIETEKPDAIIFEDYDKGNVTPNIIKAIVNQAVELNIPILVDPKKRNFFDYKNVTLFKPNFKELTDGLKITIAKKDKKNVLEAANDLREKLNAQYVMITLSEDGVLLTNGQDVFTMPAQKHEIADVSGAGDTVISVLACCMAGGLDTCQSTIIANIAGGIVCEKIGVVPVEKSELLEDSIAYFNKREKQ